MDKPDTRVCTAKGAGWCDFLCENCPEFKEPENGKEQK